MTENMPKTERARLLGMVTEVLEQDALTLEDGSAILDICIKACERLKVEITEDYLKNRLSGPTLGADET